MGNELQKTGVSCSNCPTDSDWNCRHSYNLLDQIKLEEADLIEVNQGIFNHWAVYIGYENENFLSPKTASKHNKK